MTGSSSVLCSTCVLLLAVVLVLPALCWADRDTGVTEGGCHQTDYKAFRDCVQAAAARLRRQSGESSGQFDLSAAKRTFHCQRVNIDCRFACANDTKCESLCPVCPLNVHELANELPAGEAPATAGDDAIYRTIIVEAADGQQQRYPAYFAPGRNHTTIIRLINVLNNTNHIHIPTNVTTHNVNHVNLHQNRTGSATLASSEHGGEFGLGFSADGPCCWVVVRNCRRSANGARRCQKRRQRQCGASICRARVVHAQTRRRCHRVTGECRRRTVYVPDASGRKCVRTAQWPFIACGTPLSRAEEDAQAAGDSHGWPHGFQPQMAPMFWAPAPAYYYRPPWFDYRPSADEDEYGAPAHAAHPGRDVYYEDEVNAGVDYDDDTESTGQQNGTLTAGEWTNVDAKCRLVSANGTTVEITNCTANELDENEPVVREPTVNFAADADNEAKRHRRHSERHRHLRENRIADDDAYRGGMQVIYPSPWPRNVVDYADDDEADWEPANKHRNNRHNKGKRRNGHKKHQEQYKHNPMFDIKRDPNAPDEMQIE